MTARESSGFTDATCRRCERTGFELFSVAYRNGYGAEDGGNTLEAWVCRDCRAQLGGIVGAALKSCTADPDRVMRHVDDLAGKLNAATAEVSALHEVAHCAEIVCGEAFKTGLESDNELTVYVEHIDALSRALLAWTAPHKETHREV